MKSSRAETVKDIVDLYKKVPEYSEVKHLGDSEFINKIEKLKQEFRGIRSILLDDSDEWLTEFRGSRLQLSKNFELGVKTGHFDGNRNFSGKTESTSYLSVRRCDIHPSPIVAQPVTSPAKYYCPNLKPISSSSTSDLNLTKNDWNYSSSSTISDSLSRSSSTPEISKIRRKQYVPPQNVENRLLHRKEQEKIRDQRNEPAKENLESDKTQFRVNEVPSSVSQPLYDKILKQNDKRSQRVREESKETLLAKLKPFSFSEKKSTPLHNKSSDDSFEVLNNSKNVKPKKAGMLKHGGNFKIHNNSFDVKSGQHFKAHPAPPRSKALMAALRLKEQQEYRELKKHLRAEALLKMSALPPGMASRNKNRYRSIMFELPPESNVSPIKSKSNRNKSNQHCADSDSSSTDDDRASEDSIKSKTHHNLKLGGNRNRNTRFESAGVFESTANDNNASRLRVAAAKRKEEERILREEREKLKQMKENEKRYKLRSYHSDVWRHACSYSANHDIAMRRELRMAAAILESDEFRKNMSSMLSRVRSAPLLLQGVRERRSQPCEKHRQELQGSQTNSKNLTTGGDSHTRTSSLPRQYHRSNFKSRADSSFADQGDGRSETLALAEGSSSSSDNESTYDIIRNDTDVIPGKPEVGTTTRTVSPAELLHDNDQAEKNEQAEIEAEADAIIGNCETEEKVQQKID